VDKSTLSRTDYVRIKIATRDISKVPARAEGAIIPFLYDFLCVREVEIGSSSEGGKIAVQLDKSGEVHPSLKKARHETVGC
jgi:hypothetical protein